MWSAKRKNRIIRNVVLSFLCVVISAGLLFALKITRDRSEQEYEALSQEYEKQQSEQTIARKGLVEEIEAEYRKDLDTVSAYLPGIVCWGDTLTAGSSGSVSYPYILQKYIDTYICDVYDFMASVENAEDFSRLDWDKYKVDIPVINMGVANEDTTTILGRSGVLPYVLAEDVTIPSDSEPIEMKLISQNRKPVSPLSNGNGGVNNVTIKGVEGVLSLDTDETVFWGNNKKYYFSRLAPGKEILVPKDTPVVTAASDLYKDYIHVVCIGTYGDYDSATDLVAQIRMLLNRQTANTDRYLVLGLCYQDMWRNMSKYDTELMQAFGDHFVNIRDYLCSDGLADAKITATRDDQYQASQGIVPKSLRSSSGEAGLSAAAYKLIGKIVYDRMDQLGYFDEVNKELNIVESRKKLVKDDPNYFSNMIRNWF